MARCRVLNEAVLLPAGAGARGRRIPGAALFVVALALLGAKAAVAVPGVLPPPVSAAMVESFLRATEASADQRVAVLDALAAYSARYRARREALQGTDDGSRVPGVPGDVDVERALVRRHERQWRSLQEEDEQLWAAIAAMFGEEAVPHLLALRSDRASEAWLVLGDLHPLADGARIDLGRLVDEILAAPTDAPDDGDPGQGAPADPADLEAGVRAELTAWRTRRERLLAEWGGLAMNARLSVVERLAAAGGGDEAARFRARRDAWHGMQGELVAAGVAVARHNRRSLDRLADLLPLELAMRLRAAWRREAWLPAPAADGPFVAWFARARAAAEADGPGDDDPARASEVRARLRLLEREHHDRLYRIAIELAEAREELDGSEAGFTSRYLLAGEPDPFEIAEEAWRSAIAEGARARQVADERARAAIAGLLADAGGSAGDLPAVPARAEPEEERPATSKSISADSDGVLWLSLEHLDPAELSRNWGLGASAGRDGFLPAPIQLSSVQAWVERLDAVAAEAQGPILEVLHEAYIDRWMEQHRGGAAGRAERIGRDLLARGADGEVRIPTAAEIDAVHDARRAAFDELAAIDETLLAELPLVVDGEPERVDAWLAGIRRERGRARLRALLPRDVNEPFARRGLMYLPEAPTLDAMRVDLVEICRVAFDGRPPASLSEVLAAWEAAVMVPLEAMVAARRADRRAQMQRLIGALERDDDGGLHVRELRLPPPDDDDDPDRRWDRAASALVAVHETHRERILTLLADQPAARVAFEDAFRRARWRGLYEDAQRADPAFRAALRRPDLAPATRDRLESAWMAYQGEWEALTRQLTQAGGDWEVERRLSLERRQLSDAARETVSVLLGSPPRP